MPLTPERIFGVTIVIVGKFNPPIFHPSWLAAQGLVPAAETEAAAVEIVHPEITAFSLGNETGGTMKLQVTRDKLVVATEDARKYEVARDLVIGILGVLPHTPATMLGINLESHFAKDTEERWHALGDKLAPKEPWSAIVKTPRLNTLAIKAERPDQLPGYVIVKIEGSVRVVPFGVVVSINDHFDVSPADGGTERIARLLADNWDKSTHRSFDIVSQIEGLS